MSEVMYYVLMQQNTILLFAEYQGGTDEVYLVWAGQPITTSGPRGQKIEGVQLESLRSMWTQIQDGAANYLMNTPETKEGELSTFTHTTKSWVSAFPNRRVVPTDADMPKWMDGFGWIILPYIGVYETVPLEKEGSYKYIGTDVYTHFIRDNGSPGLARRYDNLYDQGDTIWVWVPFSDRVAVTIIADSEKLGDEPPKQVEDTSKPEESSKPEEAPMGEEADAPAPIDKPE